MDALTATVGHQHILRSFRYESRLCVIDALRTSAHPTQNSRVMVCCPSLS